MRLWPVSAALLALALCSCTAPQPAMMAKAHETTTH